MHSQDRDNELNFKGNNPGAVRYGNFINYYQFHSPTVRLNLLPQEIWHFEEPFYALDIGSNAGNLTLSLYSFLEEVLKLKCHMLGIDLHPVLIERAEQQNVSRKVTFCCLDFMKDKDRQVLQTYLKVRNINKFSVIFCFSITMWIHLNHGDDGLHTFLREVFNLGKLIVIEPQPWKCYKSAVKRMKLSNEEFPLFKELKIRSDIEKEIENIIKKEFGDKVFKVCETDTSVWGRKLLIYRWCNF